LGQLFILRELGNPKVGGISKNAYSPYFSCVDGIEGKHYSGVFALFLTQRHQFNKLKKFGGFRITLGKGRAPKVGKKFFVGRGEPKKNCVTTNCVFWGPYSVKRPENAFGLRPKFFPL
jgi:hypothetical protein